MFWDDLSYLRVKILLLMKTKNQTHLILCGSVLLGAASSAVGAVVSSAGSDIDVTAAAPGGGGYWRTASVVKPNDIDGDNVLGTDGYRYVTDNPGGNGANDIESLAPSYATLNLVGNNFRGNGNYSLIDDPAGGTTRSGTFNPTAAPNNAEGAFVSFGEIVFNASATALQTVRIGIMVDNLDNIIFNSHSLRVSSNGVNVDVATTADADADNRNPDWYYFDVSSIAAGDSVEIFGTSSEGNPNQTQFPATIGAFSFDSVAVPEPSSLSLVALGAFALLKRRRS